VSHTLRRALSDATRAIEALVEFEATVPARQNFHPLDLGALRQTTRVQLPFGDGSIERCICGLVTLHIPAAFPGGPCDHCRQGA
jgi:hypothetical protein